jgi:hypothetical protein
VLVILAAISVVLTAARRMWALVEVHRACKDLTAVGGLVVLDDARPDAFTTPRPAGRVVVTRGLLRALRPDERRVLLAHETSHLVHRHAWWNLAADLAAAVNPLLRPAARAVATAVERWADEDAARTVGDRHLVAATLVRVAQLRTRFAATLRPAVAVVPAATGGDLAVRVRALLGPPPRHRPLAAAAAIAVVLASTLPAVAVQHTGEALFEHAAQLAAAHPAAAAPPVRRTAPRRLRPARKVITANSNRNPPPPGGATAPPGWGSPVPTTVQSNADLSRRQMYQVLHSGSPALGPDAG